MPHRFTRRILLKGLLTTGAASALAAVVGCQSRSPAAAQTLEFDDTPKFYQELVTSLNAGYPVMVQFASKTISRDSRMFEILGKASNAQTLWQRLRDLDTQEGRKVLRTAFAADLVEHQAVSGDEAHASNNVVEPGTVLLIAVITLILSMTAAAVTDVALRGPVSADLNFEFEPPSFHLSFVPASGHEQA